MLLAVETSGLQGSIAISDGDQLVEVRNLQSQGRRHAQTLVSEVDQLLRDSCLRPHDIRFVAVSIGPGSFTGLRVGLVFAKTYAWVNQAKLLAVDTLQAIAQQSPPEYEIVTVISDAQRGELFSASYRCLPASHYRLPVDIVHLTMPEALASNVPICGPALHKLRESLAKTHLLLDESCCQPKASTVAEVGWHMVNCGSFSVPEKLEPVYLRVSYAEEKKQQLSSP